jgi:hypothetical protein
MPPIEGVALKLPSLGFWRSNCVSPKNKKEKAKFRGWGAKLRAFNFAARAAVRLTNSLLWVLSIELHNSSV